MQNCNYEARPSRTKISKEEFDLERLRQPLDPILKDGGKQVRSEEHKSNESSSVCSGNVILKLVFPHL